jgi:hypothetical protein
LNDIISVNLRFSNKKTVRQGTIFDRGTTLFSKAALDTSFPITADKPYHLLALPLSGQCSEVIFVWSVQSALTLPISLGNPTIPTLFINTTVGNLIMIYSFRQ